MYGALKIFGGRAHPALTGEICEFVNLSAGQLTAFDFSDGETFVQIDENVRGADVFIVQPTCPPVNHNLMELLILIDAFRRASARRITAVVPYYGYGRQDKKDKPRVAITAKLKAELIQRAGADRLLTMDLHAAQLAGFFDMPVDHLFAAPVLLEAIRSLELPDLVIVSPDAGGVARARAIAKRLDVDLAIVDKRRPKANQSEVMHIIGDVDGRTCVLIDDMVDTAGTLCAAAKALKNSGAKKVVAYCTHPVLSGPAIENINNSVLDEVVVTDTIPLKEDASASPRIRQLSVADELAESIRRISNEESLSALFKKRIQPTLF